MDRTENIRMTSGFRFHIFREDANSCWREIIILHILPQIREIRFSRKISVLQYLQSYCPLLLFLVRGITWKLLVEIKNNFIQLSNTIRGVQCTRTITLSKVITELLLFIIFPLLSFVWTITWIVGNYSL
jgi:hypothetical protein